MIGKDYTHLTLADASATWRNESSEMRHTHPAYPYRHTPQVGAAVRYVVLAYIFASHLKDLPTSVTQAEIAQLGNRLALTVLLEGEVEPVSNLARAIFLCHQHDVPVEKALDLTSEELGLATNVRKAANNVGSGSRRLHLFFRHLLNPGSQPGTGSNWPPFPPDERFTNGRVLFNCIRSYHEKMGMLDPTMVTAETLRQSVRKYTDAARRKRSGKTYNKYLKNLSEALASDLLPGLSPDFLSPLSPIDYRQNANETPARLSEAEVVEAFPEHFYPDPKKPHRITLKQGFPAYYNKSCNPVPNPYGNLPLQGKRLSATALMTRLHEVRAYLWRVEQRHGRLPDFVDYFELPLMEEDLHARIKKFGHASVTVKTEYMNHIMVALTYCEIDVGPLAEKVNREIRFVSSHESTRGEEALEKGGVKELMELIDGLGIYAAASQPLSGKGKWDKAGAGYYLLRMSAQVDYLIRAETGLRPGVLDMLEVSDEPNGRGVWPVIWRGTDGLRRIHVPWIWMKQHRSQFFGNAAAFERFIKRDSKKAYMKGYSFLLSEKTSAVIDEYIENGWSHARSVKAKQTRRLLLNSEGRPMVTDERSLGRGSKLILGCVHEAIEHVRRTEGRDLVYYDRYAHRHVIGHHVDLHLPGHGLKTIYLTHSSQHGSDWYYGTSDNTLLRECLQEMFSGMPPRPEQEKQKAAEAEERMKEMQKQLDEMARLLRRKEEDGKEEDGKE